MEIAVYEMIKDMILSLGFPIFVAVWLLIRMEKLLKDLKKTIDELGVLIVTMLPTIDHLARSRGSSSHSEENGHIKSTPDQP